MNAVEIQWSLVFAEALLYLLGFLLINKSDRSHYLKTEELSVIRVIFEVNDVLGSYKLV